MGFVLRNGLQFVIADDRALFLDLVGDRYFRLPVTLDQAFRNLVTDGDCGIASGLIGSLVDHGVIVRTEAEGPLGSAAIRTATRTFDELPRATTMSVAQALAGQMRAAAWLRRTSLHSVLARVERSKERLTARGQPTPPRQMLMRIVSAHDRCDALLSAHDRCLAKSVALMQALLRRGYPAELVVGVQDRPFAAHCWVQMEGMVLNDTADHVRTFIPIYAL